MPLSIIGDVGVNTGRGPLQIWGLQHVYSFLNWRFSAFFGGPAFLITRADILLRVRMFYEGSRRRTAAADTDTI